MHILWIAWVSWLGLFIQAPQDNEKAAYRQHYQGTVQYQIGDYQKAGRHFERAYAMQPDNFYFGLAYAASLGRSGNARKAGKVLGRLGPLIDQQADDAIKKAALLQFYRGVLPCYAGNCSGGRKSLLHGLALSQSLEAYPLISAFHNAIGYAIISSKGRHRRKPGKVDWHYHVNRRDMEAALPHFKAAVEHDFLNEAAKRNLQLISDTLGIAVEYTVLDPPKPAVARDKAAEDFAYLPKQAFRALSFTDFEEIVLLLDISGSMVMEEVSCMATDRFKVMKETARYVIQLLPDTLPVGLGTIDGDCGTVPKRWIPTDSLGRYDMKVVLSFLHPDGTTPLLERLLKAPALFSDHPSRRKGIFLVSDGANVCQLPGVDICAWASSLPEKNIQLNVLTFLHADLNHAGAFTEYSCLADQTGGEILYMDNLRCSLEYHPLDLARLAQLELPPLHKMHCYGKSIELWGVYPNQ